jgi:hypothetical protein
MEIDLKWLISIDQNQSKSKSQGFLMCCFWETKMSCIERGFLLHVVALHGALLKQDKFHISPIFYWRITSYTKLIFMALFLTDRMTFLCPGVGEPNESTKPATTSRFKHKMLQSGPTKNLQNNETWWCCSPSEARLEALEFSSTF